jgi:Ras-related protein Rab-18
VYDVTRKETFENLEQWLKEVDMYTNRDGVIKLLVGNKIDKANREVTRAEGIEFARNRGMVRLLTLAMYLWMLRSQ